MAVKSRPLSVALVAPSGRLEQGIADGAARFFAGRGWQVQAGESCFAREMRFAGPDDLRLRDLQGFAADRRVDLVLAARGGYGLSRLLDGLDFVAIRAANPVIVGLSDFTAFNLAYLARAGGISFQGPSGRDFAQPVPDAFTIEHFFGALTSAEYQVQFDAEGPDCDVKGPLWGGNLTLLAALVGTPYLPKVRGGILFLEDVNEPAYRIERMLCQLQHAGVLARVRAIVLGDFSPVPPQASDDGFDLGVVVRRLRATVGVPVVTGLPFGHVPRKLTLPVGAAARLTVKAGQAALAFGGHPTLRG